MQKVTKEVTPYPSTPNPDILSKWLPLKVSSSCGVVSGIPHDQVKLALRHGRLGHLADDMDENWIRQHRPRGTDL